MVLVVSGIVVRIYFQRSKSRFGSALHFLPEATNRDWYVKATSL